MSPCYLLVIKISYNYYNFFEARHDDKKEEIHRLFLSIHKLFIKTRL